MLQTTLVKLIVITNSKDLNQIFGLRQLRQPVLPRLPIFLFSQKNVIVSYGMLIH